MRSSKAFFVIVAFLLIVLAAGVTWVGAKSDGGRTGVNAISDQSYLPIVARAVDPFQMEHDALVALYQSSNGDEWFEKDGWLGPDDHCNWHGVSCGNGRVTKLELTYNRLSGPIPKELGNLTNLWSLDLEENELSGPIPQELSNLIYLWSLDLADNQLSCWETRGVLAWALSVNEHSWDDPPGTTVCGITNEAYMPIVVRTR